MTDGPLDLSMAAKRGCSFSVGSATHSSVVVNDAVSLYFLVHSSFCWTWHWQRGWRKRSAGLSKDVPYLRGLCLKTSAERRVEVADLAQKTCAKRRQSVHGAWYEVLVSASLLTRRWN